MAQSERKQSSTPASPRDLVKQAQEILVSYLRTKSYSSYEYSHDNHPFISEPPKRLPPSLNTLPTNGERSNALYVYKKQVKSDCKLDKQDWKNRLQRLADIAGGFEDNELNGLADLARGPNATFDDQSIADAITELSEIITFDVAESTTALSAIPKPMPSMVTATLQAISKLSQAYLLLFIPPILNKRMLPTSEQLYQTIELLILIDRLITLYPAHTRQVTLNPLRNILSNVLDSIVSSCGRPSIARALNQLTGAPDYLNQLILRATQVLKYPSINDFLKDALFQLPELEQEKFADTIFSYGKDFPSLPIEDPDDWFEEARQQAAALKKQKLPLGISSVSKCPSTLYSIRGKPAANIPDMKESLVIVLRKRKAPQ